MKFKIRSNKYDPYFIHITTTQDTTLLSVSRLGKTENSYGLYIYSYRKNWIKIIGVDIV